jgi:RNA-splicing ligase RtcB
MPQGRGVIDESPAAYKDIDAVMAAQKDWSRSCTPCDRWCA